MSQEQVVAKHERERNTAAQMVTKEFGKSWDGKRQPFVKRCDRHALDEAWEMLSDSLKDAFLEPSNEKIDEKKTAGTLQIRKWKMIG